MTSIGRSYRVFSSLFFAIFIIILISLPVNAEQTETPPLESTDTTETASQTDSSSSSTISDGSKTIETDTSAASATTLSLTGGSGAGTSGISVPLPENFIFTGSTTYKIPIEVPPARQGIAPNISLMYNSYEKNGWIGIGWNLDIGAIQRSIKWGVNYSANDYVFTLNGSSSELVPRGDWGTNYYGAKIEGIFSKYYYNSSTGGWEVTTKDGTKYYYGTTSASRQDNTNGVFKWCLDKVQDTNGNYVTITYYKDQGEIYLDRIDYTGNGNLNPTNYVKFNRESRTDTPLIYISNALVKTAYRLKTIEVYGNGQLLRKYVLNYSYSTDTYRSILTSIVLYGSDGITSLPETTFNYQQGGNSFVIQSWSSQLYTQSSAWNWRGDFNGDGRTDIASWVDGSGGSSIRIHLSTGSGFNKQIWTGTQLYSQSANWNWLGDFNGDGKTDIASWSNSLGSTGIVMHLSTGSGFNKQIWTGTQLYSQSANWNWLGDFNGDGKTDIASWSNDYGNSALIIHLSTGSGFDKQTWTDTVNQLHGTGLVISTATAKLTLQAG